MSATIVYAAELMMMSCHLCTRGTAHHIICRKYGHVPALSNHISVSLDSAGTCFISVLRLSYDHISDLQEVDTVTERTAQEEA